MKLPNPEHAVVEMEKLEGYSLNSEHPSGKHKAYVFKAALGLEQKDATYLRLVLLEKVQTEDASEETPNPYGQRFVIDFDMETEVGKARIRSAWIIRNDEDFPRLTSCYVI